MIRRQHVVSNFFEEGEAMREALDARMRDTYTDKIKWHYFCDPKMYTYLRTAPYGAFPDEMFARFTQHLRQWCLENLGLRPVNIPYLHLMVNGCRLGLHSDFHNGAWGYVYSLTRWDSKKFSGGETLLLRDGVPSYKKHHVHGEVLYELVPAQFNQLLVFDDRIVHATPAIEGSMDPVEGRIALVGHIRASSPHVSGCIEPGEARRVILGMLPHLRDRLRNYKDVQGTVAYRLTIGPSGVVQSVATLTDNLVTAALGYDHSDTVNLVKGLIHQTMAGLRFPDSAGTSIVIVPVLVPIPELRPMTFAVQHDLPRADMDRWVRAHLSEIVDLDIEGSWEEQAYVVHEPVAGSIQIAPGEVRFHFDPPMWVPSQRERFQKTLTEWATKASAVGVSER